MFKWFKYKALSKFPTNLLHSIFVAPMVIVFTYVDSFERRCFHQCNWKFQFPVFRWSTFEPDLTMIVRDRRRQTSTPFRAPDENSEPYCTGSACPGESNAVDRMEPYDSARIHQEKKKPEVGNLTNSKTHTPSAEAPDPELSLSSGAAVDPEGAASHDTRTRW